MPNLLVLSVAIKRREPHEHVAPRNADTVHAHPPIVDAIRAKLGPDGANHDARHVRVVLHASNLEHEGMNAHVLRRSIALW